MDKKYQIFLYEDESAHAEWIECKPVSLQSDEFRQLCELLGADPEHPESIVKRREPGRRFLV